MKIFIDNCHGTLWFCLNVIRWVGFLVPDKLTGVKKMLYPFYFFFWFMFMVGIYVITQTGRLIQVWGNISDMTNASYLLFTNLAFTAKIINVVLRRKTIQAIIDQGEEVLRNETREDGKKIIHKASMDNRKLIYFYASVTMTTVFGWTIGVKNKQLPLQAWYPYDTSLSPAYEFTYAHQCIALVILAVVNAGLDQLVTSLVSVCRARLKLVNLSLKTLTEGLDIQQEMLTQDQEKVFAERLHDCVKHHRSALESAAQIQSCFSEPTLIQFTVVLIIICATAYQLALEANNNIIRIVSMSTYLMCMIFEVFIYCYQGSHLTVEVSGCSLLYHVRTDVKMEDWNTIYGLVIAHKSSEVVQCVYECPCYRCSVPLRRALLMMMVRASKVLELTAAGFTTLSLRSFMSIIKASYSLFSVLKQMEQ